MRRKITGVLEFVHAAVGRPGYERDDVLLLGKSVAAVVAAWTLASWLLPPQVTTFALFTTLLALQATAYRSVWHSVRYVAAVGVGVVPATGFGAVAGVHAWNLALMVLVAFAAGRLELFGRCGCRSP
ncbi:aromatic acid exporter family protein [Streptomyces sp. B8F3]|uniref:aromatic acid exporter family protein n=1 Tax=Streptomyces sp. B8F3 TaxID=3153573 RepID=UPI00325E8C5A